MPIVSIVSLNPPNVMKNRGGVDVFVDSLACKLEEEGVTVQRWSVFGGRSRYARRSRLLNSLSVLCLWLRLLFSPLQRNNHLIYPQDVAYSGLIGQAIGRIFGVAVLLHCHNMPHNQYKWRKGLSNAVLYSLTQIVERVVMRFSKHLIVTNNTLHREIRGCIPKESEVYVVPMSIALDDFSPGPDRTSMRERHGIPETAFVVGTVGRLSQIKNQSVLIPAASSLVSKDYNVYLVIVGAGEMYSKLAELTEQENVVDRVVFAGQKQNVADYLGMFDAFVLPSLSEGSPIVLLEAMAAGLPIVASRIPAVQEVCSNSEGVMLFTPSDSTELSLILERLISNPSLCKSLANQSGEMVHRFDRDAIFERLLGIIRKVGAFQ